MSYNYICPNCLDGKCSECWNKNQPKLPDGFMGGKKCICKHRDIDKKKNLVYKKLDDLKLPEEYEEDYRHGEQGCD